jgi:hypothetical protein
MKFKYVKHFYFDKNGSNMLDIYLIIKDLHFVIKKIKESFFIKESLFWKYHLYTSS